MKRKIIAPVLCAVILLNGCQTTKENSSPNSDNAAATKLETIIDTASLFSERDLSGDYDESTAISIELEGETISCDSDAVSIDGSCITLLDEGTYLVSGTLDDGQILVNADDTDKVQIVLSGVDITSANSAAIYSLNADKVFVTLAEGTDNTLTNGGAYAAIDENNIDAVIFSKTDLTLNGSGSLSVNAQAGHGVVSKDELTVTDGSYFVTAAEHGLVGKDSLAVAGGTFQITSGKDGFHAENTEDTTKGFLYIKDGTYTINAQGDAISASGDLQVDGGDFDLTTGEGSASVTMPAEDNFVPGGQSGLPGNPPQGERPDNGEEPPRQPDDSGNGQPANLPAQPVEEVQSSEAANSETGEAADLVSQKGMKADGALTVNGGVFTIDSSDDCIHSAGVLTVTSGEFTLSSGDDALHSDDGVLIQNGTFSIPYCYEGLEGLSVTVNGGDFDITAHDDGFNAAGGTDNSGFGGRDEQFAADDNAFIIINGGDIIITSDGDCIDSNGNLSINGGTLDLTCNGNGNTTLDCNGTYTNNGGNVTTNDNAESNPSGMGGGRPMGGQKQKTEEKPEA